MLCVRVSKEQSELSFWAERYGNIGGDAADVDMDQYEGGELI